MNRRSAKNKSIDITSFTISSDSNGIFYRQIKADSHIGLKEIRECEEKCLTISKGKKMLTLIDARNFHTLTPEATEYLRATQAKSRIATAIVSNELSQKITAGFVKNKAPIKIFSSENEGVKWLMGFKKKP